MTTQIFTQARAQEFAQQLQEAELRTGGGWTFHPTPFVCGDWKIAVYNDKSEFVGYL